MSSCKMIMLIVWMAAIASVLPQTAQANGLSEAAAASENSRRADTRGKSSTTPAAPSNKKRWDSSYYNDSDPSNRAQSRHSAEHAKGGLDARQ